MESISGDEFEISDEQDSTAQEKIFVTVRVRPLNGKEIAKGDASDWECINNTTIIFKNNPSERSTYPNAYTFDRVYGCDSSTKEVYEEGVKGIALSVLNGINSSIFAYGQTSSGKTYTMSGITEYAIADIYDYISRQNDREFALKFSAIEIYNECVRDLLSHDGAQLRLLDDPEKGVVVEKLTEANLRDCNHLKELISACEAERQTGETTLNEMSSRSHQILRLTVESSACAYEGSDSGRTLAASVNFVDLAGSERASQTLAAGTRLKEGSHINRSLLTLGTVIRKLSEGGKSHIPYRNSKLTRILQNSLGGNARTAIVCTMSPAHSHVDQSRNTLLFASCAKDVSTNAQVNVVISDKALVKQLQQELARLANELKLPPGSNDSAALIKEMELQIEKMGKEIEELTQQRDRAESRLDYLIRVTGTDPNSLPWGETETSDIYEKSLINEYPALETYEGDSMNKYGHADMEGSKVDFLDENSPRHFSGQHYVPDPSKEITINPEDSYKDQSIEKTLSIDNNNNIAKVLEDSSKEEDQNIEEISSINNIITADETGMDDSYESPKEITQDVQTKVERSPCSSDSEISDSEGICLTRSKSCYALTTNASSEKEVIAENTDDNGSETGKQDEHIQIIPRSKSEADVKTIDQQDSSTPVTSLDEKEIEQKIRSSDVSNEPDKKTEPEANEPIDPEKDWSMVFEKQRREIIKLWNECNTPLIHRTYFFLLFKGDRSDSVYMEVELRRLSFLKNTPSRATSARALSRERVMLSKKMLKKFSSTQRDVLFQKWGISLDSKYRRFQLSQLVWTKTNDIDHIKESAEIVAKLVGIVELNQTPKELFGLSFLPKQDHSKSSFYKSTISFT
ncbi:putative plus-end-directed kinesin ATPase [Helianthus annuus]|nr:putative plus-end-directed kinesin ATPase [Helianthus annuus]